MEYKNRARFIKISLCVALFCFCGVIVLGGFFNNSLTKDVAQAQSIEQAFEERGVDYFTTYAVGETISLHNLKTVVNDTEKMFSAFLTKDGAVLVMLTSAESQKNYVFTQKGKYVLNYYLDNDNGTKTLAKTFSITVNEQPYFNVSFASRYTLNTVISIQTFLRTGKESVQADVQITSPSGKSFFSTAETLTLDENGVWKIKYSARISAGVFTRMYNLFVEGKAETYDEYIIPLDGVGSVVEDMETPTFAKRGKGIGVVLNSNVGSFRFSNAINLNSLTKEDNIFNILPLAEGGYQYMRTMSVKLIDAYDPDNFLIFNLVNRGSRVQFLDQIYCTLEYKGVTYSLDNSGKIRLDWYYGVGAYVTFRADWLKTSTERAELYNLYQEYYKYRNDDHDSENYKKYLEYEPYADYWSYRDEAYYGSSDGFTPRYDPDEKMFYVWNEPKNRFEPLVDMDNPEHVGYGNEWKGFTTGEVYVEVDMNLMGNSGGVIVLEMGGEAMSRENSDQKGASIFFDLEENGYLPDALVGEEYKLPSVSYSVDVIDGKIKNPDYSIIKLEQEIIKGIRYTEIPMTTYESFIPTEAGVYRITYELKDSDRNKTVKEMYFIAKDSFGEKKIVFEIPTNLRVGETIIVPEIRVSGMSTLIENSVSVTYNGKDYADKVDEEVFLCNAGSIVIKCYFKDYLGQTLSYNKIIDVVVEDSPVVTMQNFIPKYAIKGRTLVLPSIKALNYAKQGSDDFEVPWTLTVDGNNLDVNKREMLVTKEHGEKLTVVYSVPDNDPIIGQITVIEAKYLGDRFYAYEGSVSVGNTENYTVIEVNADAKVDFINPFIIDVNTKNIPFAFDIPEEYSNFDSVDIYFEDYLDPSDSIFFRITYSDDGLKAQLNGRGSVFGLVQNKDGSYGFTYTANLKTFTFVNKLMIDTTKDGKKFKGFLSNRVNMHFEFNGVKQKSALNVYTISVVTFKSFFDGNTLLEYRDALTPVFVSKESYLNNSFKYGSEVTIPAMEARTLLSGTSPFTMSIVSPSGKTIVEKWNGYNDYTFLLEEYGVYKITYKVPFLQTVKTFNYTFRVFREELQEVSFGKTLKAEYSLGEKIKIPEVSTNGLLGTYKIEYVLINSACKMQIVNLGDEIKLKEAGTYVLNVTVTDEHNVVSESWFFQVK